MNKQTQATANTNPQAATATSTAILRPNLPSLGAPVTLFINDKDRNFIAFSRQVQQKMRGNGQRRATRAEVMELFCQVIDEFDGAWEDPHKALQCFGGYRFHANAVASYKLDMKNLAKAKVSPHTSRGNYS